MCGIALAHGMHVQRVLPHTALRNRRWLDSEDDFCDSARRDTDNGSIYCCPIGWDPFDSDVKIILIGSIVDDGNMNLDLVIRRNTDLIFFDHQNQLLILLLV